MVRQKDFGLFRRMLAAVQEWFDTIMDHVSEWGTQAPDVIKDLQGMRELIAEAIETGPGWTGECPRAQGKRICCAGGVAKSRGPTGRFLRTSFMPKKKFARRYRQAQRIGMGPDRRSSPREDDVFPAMPP